MLGQLRQGLQYTALVKTFCLSVAGWFINNLYSYHIYHPIELRSLDRRAVPVQLKQCDINAQRGWGSASLDNTGEIIWYLIPN